MGELIDDRRSVLRVLTGGFFEEEANVACPVCGFDYSHVQEVYTALGSDEHEARVYPGSTRSRPEGDSCSGTNKVRQHRTNRALRRARGTDLRLVSVSDRSRASVG
jgi:hypothetical protein